MKKRKGDMTIMEYAVSQAGVFKGAKICAFIAQWTIASQALGRSITLEEYAEWWHDSRATAFRHQAEFRAVFTAFRTPQPLADLALVKQAAVARGVKGVGSLPADLVLG